MVDFILVLLPLFIDIVHPSLMYCADLGYPLRTFVRFCYVMLTNVAWHAFCIEGPTDVNSYDEQFWKTCKLLTLV